MFQSFFSWLGRIIISLFRPDIVEPVKKANTENASLVQLVSRKGRPLPPPEVLDTRPFWRQLSDRKNRRAFRRKKGRESRKAWRRP